MQIQASNSGLSQRLFDSRIVWFDWLDGGASSSNAEPRHSLVASGRRASGDTGEIRSGRNQSKDPVEIFCGSRTCKPNSVCRIAPAGRSFLWAAHYCAAQATYPEVVARRAGTRPGRGLFSPPQAPSLFGLAPCGVCPARRITATAVRSYRTFSPLPRRCRRGGIFSVALSVEWTRPSKLGRGTLPDVIRHTALWSSDFPPPPLDAARATVRSSCQRLHCNSRRSSVVSRQEPATDLHGFTRIKILAWWRQSLLLCFSSGCLIRVDP